MPRAYLLPHWKLLLTLEDRYFLWITAVPLLRWCLQSRQHSGPCRRDATLALSGPPNLRPESDHRYLMLLLFRQPITSPKCIYLQSDLSCLYKLICHLFNHLERLLGIGHQQSAIFLVGCDSRWLLNDLSIPHASENMSYENIITIYFRI